MQTLGRFAIIGGTVLVALVNVILFRDVESLEQADKINLYGTIYIYALVIPLVSILGVILANYLRNKKIQSLKCVPKNTQSLAILYGNSGTHALCCFNQTINDLELGCVCVRPLGQSSSGTLHKIWTYFSFPGNSWENCPFVSISPANFQIFRYFPYP